MSFNGGAETLVLDDECSGFTVTTRVLATVFNVTTRVFATSSAHSPACGYFAS